MKGVIIFLVTCLLLVNINHSFASEPLIPNEAIRLRIIANSDDDYDQQAKQQVKENLQTKMYSLLNRTITIDEARRIIKTNLSTFDDTIKDTLDQIKYPLNYKLDFGYHYFPVKNYKGIKYDEGYYESVLVELGKGEGNNWWCVLFPPLCLLEAEEASEVEYKFFVQELISKFLKRK